MQSQRLPARANEEVRLHVGTIPSSRKPQKKVRQSWQLTAMKLGRTKYGSITAYSTWITHLQVLTVAVFITNNCLSSMLSLLVPSWHKPMRRVLLAKRLRHRRYSFFAAANERLFSLKKMISVLPIIFRRLKMKADGLTVPLVGLPVLDAIWHGTPSGGMLEWRTQRNSFRERFIVPLLLNIFSCGQETQQREQRVRHVSFCLQR